MTNEQASPWMVVAAGGTVETSFLPQRLFHLQADYDVRVSTSLSPGARDFVTPTALSSITGQPVYWRKNQLDRFERPLHLTLSESDLLLLSPATERVLAECALGIISCPVTRLFAFAPKDRVLIAPAVHPRMDVRVYKGHVAVLRALGCEVLGGDELFASWREVVSRLERRLGLVKKTPPGGALTLEKLVTRGEP